MHQLRNSSVKRVAEKVETEEELKTALDEGLGLFQGYFPGRPRIFSKRKTPVDTEHHFQMLPAIAASWLEEQKQRRCC